MKRLLLFLGVVAAFLIWAELRGVKKGAGLKPLHVFATNSFTSEWGPGPILEKEFEKNCLCDLIFHPIDGAQLLIERARIELNNQAADMIVGIDIFDIELAQEKLKFRSLSIDDQDFFSEAGPQAASQMGSKKDRGLYPYDWGLLSIVTKKNSKISQYKSFADLLVSSEAGVLALQDPRFSSPGKHFLIWFDFLNRLLNRGEAIFWQNLETLKHSYSPSWSTAYGLFTKGEVEAVWSYVTSPLYHEIEEKNFDYQALVLNEGHPVQVEYFGVLDGCKECLTAEMFANFLVSEEAQKVIMNKNYMFPVLKSAISPSFADQLAKFKVLKIPKVSAEELETKISRWVQISGGTQ